MNELLQILFEINLLLLFMNVLQIFFITQSKKNENCLLVFVVSMQTFSTPSNSFAFKLNKFNFVISYLLAGVTFHFIFVLHNVIPFVFVHH